MHWLQTHTRYSITKSCLIEAITFSYQMPWSRSQRITPAKMPLLPTILAECTPTALVALPRPLTQCHWLIFVWKQQDWMEESSIHSTWPRSLYSHRIWWLIPLLTCASKEMLWNSSGPLLLKVRSTWILNTQLMGFPQLFLNYELHVLTLSSWAVIPGSEYLTSLRMFVLILLAISSGLIISITCLLLLWSPSLLFPSYKASS